MKTAPVPALAQGFDTVVEVTDVALICATDLGRFAIRYLGSLTQAETERITAAGLGVMGVTYAGSTDGLQSALKARACGLAPGTTLWIDVESTGDKASVDIIRGINAWAEVVMSGGYQAGMYVGVDSKLTCSELTSLSVTRYWHACSRLVDRFGAIQEPARGYCLIQGRPPNVVRAGVQVDVDWCQVDYRGDVPTMTVA